MKYTFFIILIMFLSCSQQNKNTLFSYKKRIIEEYSINKHTFIKDCYGKYYFDSITIINSKKVILPSFEDSLTLYNTHIHFNKENILNTNIIFNKNGEVVWKEDINYLIKRNSYDCPISSIEHNLNSHYQTPKLYIPDPTDTIIASMSIRSRYNYDEVPQNILTLEELNIIYNTSEDSSYYSPLLYDSTKHYLIDKDSKGTWFKIKIGKLKATSIIQYNISHIVPLDSSITWTYIDGKIDNQFINKERFFNSTFDEVSIRNEYSFITYKYNSLDSTYEILNFASSTPYFYLRP